MEKTTKLHLIPGTLTQFATCLAAIAGLAATSHAETILSQNFSSDPVNYTLPGNSSPFRFEGSPPRYWAISSEVGLTVNAGITGSDGAYLGSQDLDGFGANNFSSGAPAQIDFSVAAGDFSSLNLSIALAGMPTAETTNFVRAKLDLDGNSSYETTLFEFKGNNNSAYIDTTPSLNLGALTAAFQTFPTIPIPPVTAGDGILRLRLESFNDTGSQNEATGIDSILISGTPNAPAANITSFGLPGNPAVITTTSPTTGTITWTVPYGTDVTQLAPVFTMSSGATCDHDSGITNYDFTSVVHYIVTSSDNLIVKDYAVTVEVTPASSAKTLLTFGLPGNSATITGTTVAWTVPFGTDVTNLSPAYTVSQFATGAPTTGTAVNFSAPQTYTITAQDGSTQDYTVTVTVAPFSASYGVNFDARYDGSGSPGVDDIFPISSGDFFGPPGAEQVNWNNVHSNVSVNFGPSGGSFNRTITDSSASNPITLTIAKNNQGGNDGSGTPSNNFERLYMPRLRDNDGQIRLTLDPQMTSYSVYVYGAASTQVSATNAASAQSPRIPGNPYASGFESYGAAGTAFVLNTNYRVYTDLTGPLTITANNSICGFSIVNTSPQGTAYDSWAQTNITAIDAGADATETGNPDGDGSSNFAEFAFHGNPLSGSDQGYLRSAIEDTDGDTLKELTLTLAVRNAAGAPVFTGSPSPTATVDGVIYTIQGSLDLAFPNSVVTETPAPTGLPVLPSGWEYRRFRLDASEGLVGKGFMRAAAEPAP